MWEIEIKLKFFLTLHLLGVIKFFRRHEVFSSLKNVQYTYIYKSLLPCLANSEQLNPFAIKTRINCLGLNFAQ